MRQGNFLPLIAVVTPVYNGVPYLDEAMRCVQQQTYPNLVHVVLDNASTDETHAIIARHRRGRVPIITRRNSSLLAQIDNWNAAVGMTPPEARYIKLLCADDLMRADCIERLQAVTTLAPDVEFATAIDVVNDCVKPHGFEPDRAIYPGRDVAMRILTGAISWMPFHQMFFRVTPERLHNPFSREGLPTIDAEFVLRLLTQGNMGFVNAPLYYTRAHEASVTTQRGGDRCFIYPAYVRLRRFGPKLMPPAEFESQHAAYLRLLLRHVVADALTGRMPIAQQTLRQLAGDGFTPGIVDYAHAILSWPLHKLRKTKRLSSEGGAFPGMRVPKAEFLASLPSLSAFERSVGQGASVQTQRVAGGAHGRRGGHGPEITLR